MSVYAGEGTVLKVDVSSTLTAVAQVVSISGPDSAVPEVETTHLGSTAKEYRPGEIPEAGTIDFSILFDPGNTGHAELVTLAKTPSVVSWQVTFTDGSTMDWEGFLTSFSVSGMEDESNLAADCTVRITGQITFTGA